MCVYNQPADFITGSNMALRLWAEHIFGTIFKNIYNLTFKNVNRENSVP